MSNQNATAPYYDHTVTIKNMIGDFNDRNRTGTIYVNSEEGFPFAFDHVDFTNNPNQWFVGLHNAQLTALETIKLIKQAFYRSEKKRSQFARIIITFRIHIATGTILAVLSAKGVNEFYNATTKKIEVGHTDLLSWNLV